MLLCQEDSSRCLASARTSRKNMEISTMGRAEFHCHRALQPEPLDKGGPGEGGKGSNREEILVRESCKCSGSPRGAAEAGDGIGGGRGRRPREEHNLLMLSSSFLTCLQLMILCFLFIPTANGFYIDEKQSPRRHEWSYDQRLWPKLFSSCSLKAQSPIDIQAKNVIQSNHLRLYFYNYNRQFKFKLQNAHHTVKMNPLGFAYQADGPAEQMAAARHHQPDLNSSVSLNDMITADEYVELAPSSPAASASGPPPNANGAAPGQKDQHARLMSNNNNNNNKGAQTNNNNHNRAPDVNPNDILSADDAEQSRLPYEGAPTIKLDWLDDGNNEYKLRDVHFHWGERRDNGSEHAIDGRRAAMEMHLVHIKHGLDKSKIGFTSDSVAVIAILIESHRKSNADFNPIVNVLSHINMTDEPMEIEYKSINDLLPSNLNSFYTYSGSLTTPPCYQVVNWIVMTERLNMNAKQIEMFRSLYAPPQEFADQPDHRELDTTTTTDSSHEHQHHKSQLMVPNIRSLQALNNRTILASFSRWPASGWAATAGAVPAMYHLNLHHYLLPMVALILLHSRQLWGTQAGSLHAQHQPVS